MIMRSRYLRAFPVIFAVLVLTILVVPQYARATTQQQITEIANFQPYESNNDAVDNIANDTIPLNVDTWDPLPSGMFVGGVLRESLIELREYSPVASEFIVAQPVKFSQTYVSSGASKAVVRLPVACGPNSTPTHVEFEIFKMTSATDYQVQRTFTYYGLPIGGLGSLDTVSATGGDLELITVMGSNFPLSASPSQWFYERANRVYVNVNAPLHSEQWYLMVAHLAYAADKRWDFYLSPADLASDSNTASKVAYLYRPNPGDNITNTYSIPADLGFSFVFQVGIGDSAVSYERYFNAGDSLGFTYLVPIGAATYYIGALNWVIEFRLNASQHLTWGVEIISSVGGVDKTVLNHAYWTGKLDDNVMLASNPANLNYTATITIAGVHYIKLRGTIFIEAAQRATFLMFDAGASALYDYQLPYQRVWHFNALGHDVEQMFFDLWMSASIDNRTYNMTGAVSTHHSGFWKGVGHWFNDHWTDIIAIELIAIGVLAAPFTLGGSLVLIGIGVGMILYNNWGQFRDFVNGLAKFVLDGLSWLGNWLWKLGMWISKALTWFIDRLVDFGSQLLALVIYGLAVMIPLLIITMTTKLMSVFYKLAKGDLEGAAAEGKSLVHTATLGKVG